MVTGHGTTIVDDAWLTLQPVLLSVPLAIILGPLGVAFRLSPVRRLVRCGDLYATVARDTSDLVLTLLIFYDDRGLLNQVAPRLSYDDYIDLNSFMSGVGTLGFIFGAYLSETFRGAFMAAPRDQGEAGYIYGMSHRQVSFHAQVPQMIRLVIPDFISNWLVLTKATALISVVGLQDMMFKAKQASDMTREPFTYYLIMAGLYLLVASVSLLLLRLLEHRYSVDVKTAEL